MKKNFVLCLLLIVIVSLLAACGSNQKSTSDSTNKEAAVSSTNETTYPLEVKIFDEAGKEYTQTFEKAPERIVTNNLSITEMLIELGLQDKIVGITNPDNKVTGKYADTVNNLNNLGDKMKISREMVIGVKPDIVVGRSLMFEDEYMGSISTLNDLGVQVFTQSASIVSKDPKLTAVIEDVLTLGKIFNVNDKAQAYANELTKRYDAIVEKVDSKEDDGKPLTVLAMVGFNSKQGTYLSFDVTNGLQRDVLTTLNLEPAIDGRQDTSNLETLISTNPDIILYIEADRNADLDKDAIASLYNEPLIKNVSAIKEKRIYTTTYDDFMDYGPRIFDTLEMFGNEIYGK